MVKIDAEKYIGMLNGLGRGGILEDWHSIKSSLQELEKSSDAFDNFENASRSISRDELKNAADLSALMEMRKLASQIKEKKMINGKLSHLHSHLRLLNGTPTLNDISPLKSTIDAFLHNDNSKIDLIIDELNDFKKKLSQIDRHHLTLMPKSLEGKIGPQNRYQSHIESLHSIHNMQKNVFMSTLRLFIKMTKENIGHLKRFK